jgi:spore maturation protein CgeB
MAEMGYCPSGRLFEAAACGTPVISDWWDGLDSFFEPGEEILLAETADEVEEALMQDPQELQKVARAARSRVLSEHTAERRCHELVQLLEEGV